MKCRKPPTTMKTMCNVKSSLVAIRKTLSVLSEKGNFKFTANVDYNDQELTEQTLLDTKEVANIKGGSYADESATLLQGSFEEYVPNCPISVAGVNLQLCTKQDSIINRIDSPDVTTATTTLWRKKISEGEIGLVQKDNKLVSTANQANTKQHKLCNAIHFNLPQVTTTSNVTQDNMSTRRKQRLKSRKLYNPSDVNAVHAVHACHTVSVSEVLGNSQKDFESTDLQQNVFRAASSSPEPASIRKVVEAVLEPLPEDKGKNFIPKKIQRVVTNKNASKKVIPINFDAIEVSNFPDNRAHAAVKRNKINLPRALTELNRNINSSELETDGILCKKRKCSRIGKQINFPQCSVKLLNENVGKSSKQECGVSDGKENCNLNLNNSEILPSKKVTKGKGRIVHHDTPLIRKRQKKKLETKNVTQRITRRKNTIKDCTSTVLYTVLTSCSSTSNVLSDTTAAKNHPILIKGKTNKSYNRNCSPDIQMREATHDGYESLHSDNELFSITRKTTTVTQEPKLKYVARPIRFKPKFKPQRKLSSSSSSPLPDLEIEVEKPYRPVMIDKLTTDSDSLEDNLQEPVKVPPENADVNLRKEFVSKNPNEECVPVVVCNNSIIEMPANVLNQVAHQSDSEGFFKSQDSAGMDNDVNVLKTRDNAHEYNLSLQINEESLGHSNEAIMSWVATGLPNDATEVFKSNVEVVLSSYADIIKVYLQALRGPVHPSLNKLYDILIKHDHDFNCYLKKK